MSIYVLLVNKWTNVFMLKCLEWRFLQSFCSVSLVLCVRERCDAGVTPHVHRTHTHTNTNLTRLTNQNYPILQMDGARFFEILGSISEKKGHEIHAIFILMKPIEKKWLRSPRSMPKCRQVTRYPTMYMYFDNTHTSEFVNCNPNLIDIKHCI